MQERHERNGSLCQQAIALLWKNVILKWRIKKECFQEWIPALFLLLILFAPFITYPGESGHEIPEKSLGQLDDPSFKFARLRILYTPGTKMAREIMKKVATLSVMKDIPTDLAKDEQTMDSAQKRNTILGVLFQDDFSYHLRLPSHKAILPTDVPGSIVTCSNYSASHCKNPSYWTTGFLSLQSSIDSAIIELTTNQSVWDEMMTISGIRMRTPLVFPTDSWENCIFLLIISMSFSPFIYFLSQNVSREKRKLKEVMRTMGLRDAAFWLSWAWVCAVNILVMSCLVTAIVMERTFITVGFHILFLLFFLYGISLIFLCFMMSSLLKKPKPTSLAVLLLTLCFGGLGTFPLFTRIPAPVEWTLTLFCPFAFATGITKVFNLKAFGRIVSVSDLMEEKYIYALIFDSILYMLLAVYFDKVVPDKYGVPYPPWFFLTKSYWCKPRSGYTGVGALNIEPSPENDDNAEAVPPEFDGKEAIRLTNIEKTYGVKSTKTEALRGLSLNIYEGQITAILGHNGAGKTTLLNILSGLSKPSNGSATIFTYNISERADMEQIWKISAVCPQFNIQFEHLTVKENLNTFAKIKGVPSRDIESEVQKLLTLLNMSVLQDTRANNLSGGQKRKLSLAIAFLGEPQVLFLDEPTAGLDPYSRQQVWSLLNERKTDRVTLFTTQLMDEADILADRKAFISHGKLQCVGSSLFLKKKWGIGYHLRMDVNEFCDPERTTALVKQHVTTGRLSGQRENELSYILPLDKVEKFPDLFCDIDQQADLGIVNYGLTVTTLEDVFLTLEGTKTTDEEGPEVLPSSQEGAEGGEEEEEERAASSPGEVDQELLLLSDTGKSTIRGAELWRQQVRAIARMHFLNLKRERKVWGALSFISAVIFAPLIIQIIAYTFWEHLHSVELHPGLYFEPGTNYLTGYSGLLILNDTGESIDNFVQAVKSQNILLDVITGSNVSGQLVHNGAIKVALHEKKYRFTLMCHTEVINCFPVLVNIISNALLQMSNSTARIRIWNRAFVEFYGKRPWLYLSNIYFILSMLVVPAFPMHFAMNSVRYYKIKCHAQLRVSGLFTSAYWCGLALVDIPLCWILLLLVYGPWFLFLGIMISSGNANIAMALVFFSFFYGVSLVLLLYVLAFLFRKKAFTSSFWSFIFIIVTLIFLFIFLEMNNRNYQGLSYLNFLVPMMTAMNCLSALTETLLTYEYKGYTPQFKKKLLVSFFGPLAQSVVFLFLLGLLEMKYGGPVMRKDPIFRALQAPLAWCRISPPKRSTQQNPEQPSEDEDRDVQEERARVQSALESENHAEKPVIIVHNLRKEYKSKKACCNFKKGEEEPKKVATRNVSFCVKKGEVLGLLGPNGAGKSTTLNMITQDTDLTAGKVLIKGADAAPMEESAVGFLGYCPQEKALWPNLTVKEHLEIYAAVKGIQDIAATIAVSRIVEALELQDHFKKTTKTLAAGVTRKLCFALSILGSSTVVLLDEPTTGMDPKGKRQVWKAIHTVLKDKDQGAILTTHHMEEAEAVCDRVAIMVSGMLRCLGSIQYMKSKFGKHYLLQIKVKGVEQGDLLNTEILKLFPQAARQERVSTLLVYKIPMEDALPLSKAFSQLEEAKQRFGFEDYNFSLNTLEQVFLELCKEQERDCHDVPLDTTFDWQQLQQEDLQQGEL